MKKLMVIAAAALCGSFFAAGEVTSANVVGYQTLTIYPGNNMFTVNFGNMADAQGYTLEQLFPGTTEGLVGGTTAAASDRIKAWDPTADNGAGAYSDTYYFFIRNNNANSRTWRKSATVAADVKIKSGMCFWFYHNAPVGSEPLVFTVPGQVEYSQQGASMTIRPGMNMIGAPFAGDADLNTLGTDFWKALVEAGNCKASTAAAASDFVKIWDPQADNGAGAYGDTYYLFYRNNNANSYTWRKNASTIAPAGFIKMGVGAWYYCGGTGFTMTLPYPYDL
ncbi:MAG: hypothetical protein J6Q60_10265 [Bacteroidaceae bacterium]|nr:hypothetical protein [Bacteroidaceae bacterium]